MAKLKALILEDEALIALDVEQHLRECGFSVTLVTSCEAADHFLSEQDADVAIVDLKLTDGYCHRVARVLIDRSIPFIVHSGSDEIDEPGQEIFRRGRLFRKPADTKELAAVALSIATGANTSTIGTMGLGGS
ncbi:response regulator [Mesorhizobium sp. ES1-1]|uniref:response regulator n=1 Tax=Mesorhizobium sp. ES1-1 TaxID=2876629 RepID=UPI001CCE5E1C|nr:response regulator [Mesorhizobium sp. ES1-1]MBZ9676866.1 response regulator [Mesorhizobium sp. ES1-1]